MPAAQPVTGTSLEITRTFAAPPERVFDAWTKPEIMTKWFSRRMEGTVIQIHELDLRAGGRLRLSTHDPSGKSWNLFVIYTEVRKPERLSFTWSWENEPSFGESVVTVDFRRLGNSNFTEVKLRHEGFPTADACKGHEAGWNACYAMLEAEFPEFAHKNP